MRHHDFLGFENVYIGFGGHEVLPPQDYGYCVVYSTALREMFFDAGWRSGLSFAILGTIFSGVPMILSFLMACFSFDTSWTKLCGWCLLLASLFEFLTFTGFTSNICADNQCVFSIGAVLAILGGVNAWLTAGVFMRIQPYEAPPSAEPGLVIPGGDLAPGTVQVTEQILPDGTKKTIKTTVKEDGSRVVEETVEAPPEQP